MRRNRLVVVTMPLRYVGGSPGFEVSPMMVTGAPYDRLILETSLISRPSLGSPSM